MELLAQFIAPILSLWVIHNAIFRSAAFVNDMRETVISGFYRGQKLRLRHREGIRLDWALCMAATILVCVLFAVIVAFVGGEILNDEVLSWVAIVIALYPLACAFGFMICGWNDHKMMKDIE